jgi:RluA family pseudouridine synthase
VTKIKKSKLKKNSHSKPHVSKEHFRKLGVLLENITEPQRIDAYLAKKFQFHSRKIWYTRIENHELLVEHCANKNRKKEIELIQVKPTYKIKNYDQIWIFHPPECEPDLFKKIDLVFDDGDVCVFAKPPHMVVHAAGMYGKNNFINVVAKMGDTSCFPVHRIDKETSGILLCARQSSTRKLISLAFRQGHIQKMYLAVTKGLRFLPEKFRVHLPIGTPEQSFIRLKLWVHGQNAQHAETWFSKLATFEDYTLFACLPQTGRTNQIRIHLAAIGHWIVGDKMYHKNEQVFLEFYEKGLTSWVQEQVLFHRHMLHNVAIMAPKIPLPALSEKPIVCELDFDLRQSEIVKNLCQKIPLSENISEQKKYFEHIFLQLHQTDFYQFPEIFEGE